MANVVQLTVDAFMQQAQAIKDQLDQTTADLTADAATLGQLYQTAQANMDPYRDAFIAPAIHQNTVLRIQYLKPAKTMYVNAVNSAAGVLRSAGLTAPNLSGLGIAPAILVPLAAVTLLAACAAAAYVVQRLTQAQINNTSTLQGVMANANLTPDQKLAQVNALNANMDAQRKANPPPFDVSQLVLPLAIVAAIVIAPSLLRLLPQRKGAAA